MQTRGQAPQLAIKSCQGKSGRLDARPLNAPLRRLNHTASTSCHGMRMSMANSVARLIDLQDVIEIGDKRARAEAYKDFLD